MADYSNTYIKGKTLIAVYISITYSLVILESVLLAQAITQNYLRSPRPLSRHDSKRCPRQRTWPVCQRHTASRMNPRSRLCKNSFLKISVVRSIMVNLVVDHILQSIFIFHCIIKIQHICPPTEYSYSHARRAWSDLPPQYGSLSSVQRPSSQMEVTEVGGEADPGS